MTSGPSSSRFDVPFFPRTGRLRKTGNEIGAPRPRVGAEREVRADIFHPAVAACKSTEAMNSRPLLAAFSQRAPSSAFQSRTLLGSTPGISPHGMTYGYPPTFIRHVAHVVVRVGTGLKHGWRNQSLAAIVDFRLFASDTSHTSSRSSHRPRRTLLAT